MIANLTTVLQKQSVCPPDQASQENSKRSMHRRSNTPTMVIFKLISKPSISANVNTKTPNTVSETLVF